VTISEKQGKFLKLFEPLQERLERFVLNLTRNRDKAKDIVSETILIAYENFDEIKDKEAMLGYLFTIANRLYYRQKAISGRFVSIENLDLEKLFAVELSVDDKLDIRIIYDTLETLPEKQSEIFLLFEVFGFSINEIAKIMDISTANTKVKLFRIRKKVREILGVDVVSKMSL
jgi:RNA polymerase sigma-70 factor, ECF subfamily